MSNDTNYMSEEHEYEIVFLNRLTAMAFMITVLAPNAPDAIEFAWQDEKVKKETLGKSYVVVEAKIARSR